MSKISQKIYSSSMSIGWQKLPDIIFGDIMMMVGLKSCEDMHKCRRVSQSWSEMISLMTKFKKDPIRKKAENLAAEIRDNWMWPHAPILPEITTAASLAHHGILGSVEDMVLENVDLTSVPVKHLASLASCVTQCVEIINISNVIIILDSVNCETLSISRQSLSSEDTKHKVFSSQVYM